MRNRWSQAQLAKKVGVTSQAISDVETGTTVETAKLPDIARALQTTAEWLKYGDRPAPKQPDYQADLDRINEIVTTGRLAPKIVKALRDMAETMAQ